MTKVVTFANQAGSVGKSTGVVNLAALLAADGTRVLVVDLDAQANATSWLGVDPDGVEHTSGDVLLRRVGAVESVVASALEGVWVLPGRDDLTADTVELQQQASGVLRLRKPVQEAVEKFGVDVVLLDCPGSMTLLTWCALAVSTSAVTVTTPAQKEIAGIDPFIETVDQVAEELEVTVAVEAIIPSSVPPKNHGRVYVEALAYLQQTYTSLVTPPVRRAPVVAVAASRQQPVVTFAPREPVSGDYAAVLADLRERAVLP